MPVFDVIRREATVARIEAHGRNSAMTIAQSLSDSCFERDYELDSLDIEYIGECGDTYNAPCIENCTSCLDTKCIFHETNRDTDEYKELSRELRRRIAEVE